MRIDGDRLWIPDYAGNNMYNTLGNLSVNPTAGLLFIDFDTGDTLQLSGVADIKLLEAVDAATGGTNPRVDVHHDGVDTLAAGHTIARRVARDVTAQSLSPHHAAAVSGLPKLRVRDGPQDGRSEAGCGRVAQVSYSIRRPLIAREMTSCWICSVPSKMSMILASRWKRSTGYSRT